MKNNDKKDYDLDVVLVELGEFGKYQIINYWLICLPVLLSVGSTLSYVFTAGNLHYRCEIPGCDYEPTEYTPAWLPNAVPYKNGHPSKCLQYVRNDNNITGCSINDFNTSHQTSCSDVIYKDNEVTIVNEFNIICDENEWQLTAIGSINNLAQFIFMPIAGILSDRYGRRTVLVTGVLLSTVFGVLRSFSINYTMFWITEFIDAACGVGTYSAVFILGMELLGPEKRVLGGALISSSYSIGAAVLGVIAMYTEHFRILLRIVFLPGFIMIFYYWIIPESVRWLMSMGRKDEAVNIILKAAKTNNVVLSDATLKSLYNSPDKSTTNNTDIRQDLELQPTKKQENPMYTVLKSRILLIRLAICSFCWLTNAFVYYGLSLTSVALGGNKYMNFILVCLADLPAYVITYFMLDRLGRRWSLCGSLLVCGLACFGTIILPENSNVLQLLVFLLGKCAITTSFTVLYVYTTELYPTNLRHSLMSTCSMIGRIGSVVAPQAPLLANYMSSLPLLLFGGTAIISGISILQFPETLHTKLPDTIEEAKNIGRKPKSDS